MLDQSETSTPNPSIRNPVAGNPVTGDPIEPSGVADPLCVMLVLDPPPTPWTLADWHLRKIAGVPFLLRNILTVQRLGVKRMVVYLNEEDSEGLDSLAQAFGDLRIHLEIDLISETNNFINTLKVG